MPVQAGINIGVFSYLIGDSLPETLSLTTLWAGINIARKGLADKNPWIDVAVAAGLTTTFFALFGENVAQFTRDFASTASEFSLGEINHSYWEFWRNLPTWGYFGIAMGSSVGKPLAYALWNSAHHQPAEPPHSA